VVLAVGELSLHEYTTNSGEKRTSLELRAREIKFGGDAPERTSGSSVDAVSDITISSVASDGEFRNIEGIVEELPW